MAKKSELIWGIAQQATLRWRVEALVRERLWNVEENSVYASIPMEQLIWAIATNPSVQSTVTAAMEAHAEGSPEAGSYVLGVADIPDSDLEYILFTVALPRLALGETIN